MLRLFHWASLGLMVVDAIALIWALAVFLFGKVVAGRVALLPVEVEGPGSRVSTPSLDFCGGVG